MRGLPASQGRAAAAPRAAAVAILLAVTAAGLQARGAFSHAPAAQRFSWTEESYLP